MRSPHKTPAIDVRNVSLSYGALPIVKRVSFSVAPGECFGLIGLNGAGKTTLMKTLLGLRPCNEGQIKVFDNDPGDIKAKEQIAYLPERFEPPWFLTGLEFLKFSAGLYGTDVHDEGVFYEAADLLALDRDALGRRVDTYPKGMRQKLGILSTTLTQAELLVLDEPMSGLDPLSRHMVKALIRQMQQEGRTVFFSSHILADMDELCDSVAVLHEGKICYTGTPDALKKGEGGGISLEERFIAMISEMEGN